MVLRRRRLYRSITLWVVFVLLSGLVVTADPTVAEADIVNRASSETGETSPAEFNAEWAVDPERFPDGTSGRELATRASTLDPYRASDSEVSELQVAIDELVFSSGSQVAALQPAIEEATTRETTARKKRDELQLVADDLGQTVAGLAIQNFRSANRAYATMSLEVTESDDVETQRRTAQTLELVTDDSTADYSRAAAQLEEAAAQHTELQNNMLELEQEQNNRQELAAASLELQTAFGAMAQTRSQRIQQRSLEAIEAERSDTPLAVAGSITVNQSIAPAVEALLADAAEDGIVFGGWGQRPVSRQIELRRSHCGSSEWAIFDKRSGTCSPPTARPGRSQHELGLAIDFTENGSVLTRSSPGFVWLRANAAKYGLKNLPSEPWHWSTTGN